MAKSKKIELTEKELILVWSIVAWFQVSPLVTSRLMHKLYPDAGDKQYRYDDKIQERIIEIGKWLESKGYPTPPEEEE